MSPCRRLGARAHRRVLAGPEVLTRVPVAWPAAPCRDALGSQGPTTERTIQVTHALEPAWQEGPGTLDPAPPPGYAHLPLCVVDAIFSIRANDTSARHAVQRYAGRFGVPDVGFEDRDGSTEIGLDQLVAALDGYDEDDLVDLFCDNHRLAARLKAAAVPRAAATLVAAGIVRTGDLADPRRDPDGAAAQEATWREVPGCGATNWHTVLTSAGIPDARPRTPVQRWVEDAVGSEVAPQRAGDLLDELARELRIDRATLDHTVARYQRQR